VFFHEGGVNVPTSKVSGSVYGIIYRDSSETAISANLRDSHLLHHGAGSGSSVPTIADLVPEEAWNIDKKIDDGQPRAGKVGVTQATVTTCATSSTPATYVLTQAGKTCNVSFKQEW
jgi:hypothetical protein